MPNTNNSESNNTNNAAANNTNNTVEKSNFDTFLGWLKKCKRNEWEWFNNMIDGPIQGFSKVTGIPIYDFINKFRADDKKQKPDDKKNNENKNDKENQDTGKQGIKVVSKGQGTNPEGQDEHSVKDGPMPKPEEDTLSEVTMTPDSEVGDPVGENDLKVENNKRNISKDPCNPDILRKGIGFGQDPAREVVLAAQRNGRGIGNGRG